MDKPRLIWDETSEIWIADTPDNRRKIEQNSAQREHSVQTAAKEKALAQSPWQNFLSGAGGELGALKEGAMALISEPNPEAMQSVAVNQALPNYSPAAYAGQLAGSLGASMGLGYPIAKGLGMAARIPGLAGIGGPIATNAATGAAYEALKAQGDRGEAAALGALGGVMGPTVLKAAGGVRNISPNAQQMMDEGIPLTMGMVSGSPVVGPILRRTEQTMQALPISGSVVGVLEERALKGWDKSLLKTAASYPDLITEAGRKGLKQVKEQSDVGYKTVMATAPDKINIERALDNIRIQAAEVAPKLTPDAQEILNAQVRQLMDYRFSGIPKESVKKIKNQLWEMGDKQYGNDYLLHDTLKAWSKEVNEAFKQSLTPENRARLEILDELKSKYYPIKLAHEQPSVLRTDVLTPEQYMSALKRDAGKSGAEAMATGDYPGMEAAIAANNVFRPFIPRMGPGTAEKVLTGMGIGTAIYDWPTAVKLAAVGAGLGAGAYALRPMMTGQSWITPYARALYDASQRYAPGALAMPGITAMRDDE